MVGVHDGGRLIRDMTAALRHRGPDGAGHCSQGVYHLGATRLSIIDPAGGVQPVYNEAGDACVVFNGEIYNHRELRAELQRKGHVFRTSTDTEVIIHLYEEMGDRCVESLDGMFAFAVLDGARIFLARDRLGIKPLFVTVVPETNLFLFASEIKSLLRCPAVTPRLDTQALADAIALGHPVGEETFFEGIRSLQPGHTMVVSHAPDLRIEAPKPYYQRDLVRAASGNFEDAQATLEEVLDHAVATHLAADVDVALTLSGGIDSSLLALLASRQGHHPLLTFAVADHEEHADVQQALRVATMIGSTHETVIMSFEDYLETIPGLIAGEEQPCSLYGVPYHFLCRVIAQRVKVSLHGEGADELFGGYVPYIDRQARLSYITKRLPFLKHLAVKPSDRAFDTIERLSSPGSFEDYLRQLFYVNMGDPLERQHLVPVDKCAMASGLEMRVPYLDSAVVRFAGELPLSFLVRPDLSIRKYILRHLVLSRFGMGMADVVMRQKFGAPSAGVVLLDRFDRLCDEILPDKYVSSHEFGGCFSTKRELLVFDMFLEIFMKHRGDCAAVGGVMEFLHARAGCKTARAAGARAGAYLEKEGIL